MLPYPFDRIYLDEKAESDPVSQQVLKKMPLLPVERVSDKRTLIKLHLSVRDPIGSGKRNLFITRFYGRRLKPCPGTSNHICCGYYVINAITNCPMDCSYCVLQGYLNNPFLTLYSNWDELLEEIRQFLEADRHAFLRLGTGELSDSLALDSVFSVSQILVPFFAESRRGFLELKTKSDAVDHLLTLDHRGRTIVSWSLNPSRMIDEEERGTASLSLRIEAAKRCQEKGYLLGFHFDPLIHHKGWEEGYREVLQYVFHRIDPKRVAWISLGGFRYPPHLKAVSKERFPDSKIFLGELFPGKDGKFRYLKEIRIEMYRAMLGWLREIDPSLFVYLCMETREVWERVFGWSPQNSSHLNRLFETRLRDLSRE